MSNKTERYYKEIRKNLRINQLDLLFLILFYSRSLNIDPFRKNSIQKFFKDPLIENQYKSFMCEYSKFRWSLEMDAGLN